MSKTLTATENPGTQGGRAALECECQTEEQPAHVRARTFGVRPGGCQCVVRPLALAHIHSYPFRWVDGSEGFGCSTYAVGQLAVPHTF
jgi:hypothetical protein